MCILNFKMGIYPQKGKDILQWLLLVLFHFTSLPWGIKAENIKAKTQHPGCAWGILNLLLNQWPLGLFHINAAPCALRLGRSDNICVKK